MSVSDAAVFASYVHQDDDFTGGAIRRFDRDLAAAYEYANAHKLDVFLDQDDIDWGAKWPARINQALTTSTFLLAIVTPRYLTSEACRHELLDFAATARAWRSAAPSLGGMAAL